MSTALSAQNLVQIEKQAVEQVVIPCPFCFRRLLSAQDEMQADAALKKRGRSSKPIWPVPLQIRNLLGFLRYQVGLEAIGAQVTQPLSGLKLLPYYGCYLVKP